MSEDTTLSAIYTRVIRAGSRYEFAEPWSGLSSDAAVLRAPADSVPLLNALQQQFPIEALERSGVISTSQNGAPGLNPALLGPENALLALRDTRRSLVFDLLTVSGCVSGRALPAIAMLQDRVTTDVLRSKSQPLCIAFVLRDMLLLRSLGLPTALATGLGQLGRAELEEFCRAFGLSGQPSISPAAAIAKPNLLFVGWSPSELSCDPPEGLSEAAAHFANLRRHLGIELRTVRVWRPTATDLDALRFCLQYSSIDEARRCITRSLERSSSPLVAIPSRAPQDVVEAQLQFHEMHNGRRGYVEADRAMREFQETFERDVVLPQLERALAESEPQQRGMGVLMAELLRHLATILGAYSQRVSQNARAARRRGHQPLPDPDLQELQRDIDQVIRTISRINRSAGPTR